MKRIQILLLIPVILLELSCSKSTVKPSQKTFIYNPTPGSQAATIEASLIGNWQFVKSTEVYYGTTTYEIDQSSSTTGNSYWTFYSPDPNNDYPTNLKTRTSLTDGQFGTDILYLIEVDGGTSFLLTYSQTPSDGNKSELDFIDSNNIRVINTNISPKTYFIGNIEYTANNVVLTQYYKRVQ